MSTEEAEKDNNKPFETVSVPHKNSLWEFPVFTGYMTKQGQVAKNWKKRFFILTHDGRLWYFKNEKQKKPLKKEPVYVQCMKFWSSDKKQNCIKIERYPNSFFFYAPNPGDKDVWMDKLTEVGCNRCVNLKPTPVPRKYKFQESFPAIHRTDVKTWNSGDVSQWLELILHSGFLEDTSLRRNEKFEKYFKSISGKALEKTSEKDVRNKAKVDNEGHREYVLKAVKDLKINRIFPYGEYVVSEKIMNHVGRDIDRVSLRNFSAALSDPEVMTETFLNLAVTSYKKSFPTMEYYLKRNELDYEDDEDYEEENEGEDDENVEGSGKNKEEEEMKKKLLDGIDGGPINLPMRDKMMEMKVKIVLIDLVRKDWDRASVFLQPTFDKLPPLKKGNEFNFRTALVVGPWFLDFENSHSLCVPRKLGGYMASYFAGWKETFVMKEKKFGEIVDILAEKVCEWNTTHVNQKPVPSLAARLEKKTSQEFVDDVIDALGLKLDEGNETFVEFMKKIKEKGSSGLYFDPSPEFCEKFKVEKEEEKKEEEVEAEGGAEGGDEGGAGSSAAMEEMFGMEMGQMDGGGGGGEKGIHFKTHAQLDEFLEKCFLANEEEWKNPHFFKGEKNVLWSFDRVFWLKHYKDPENKKFACGERQCPLGPSKGAFHTFQKMN